MVDHSDYKVGLICALPIEVDAARALLDEVHNFNNDSGMPKDNNNSYEVETIDSCDVIYISGLQFNGINETRTATRVLNVGYLRDAMADDMGKSGSDERRRFNNVRWDLRGRRSDPYGCIKRDLSSEIRLWLAALDSEISFQTARSQGTAERLLKPELCIQWTVCDIQPLWIHGNAGCDRTALAASIVDEIQCHRAKTNWMCCPYAFLKSCSSRKHDRFRSVFRMGTSGYNADLRSVPSDTDATERLQSSGSATRSPTPFHLQEERDNDLLHWNCITYPNHHNDRHTDDHPPEGQRELSMLSYASKFWRNPCRKIDHVDQDSQVPQSRMATNSLLVRNCRSPSKRPLEMDHDETIARQSLRRRAPAHWSVANETSANAGVAVNKRDDYDKTALVQVAHSIGGLVIARILLNAGSDVNFHERPLITILKMSVANTLLGLGLFHYDLNELVDAEKMYILALQSYECTLGLKHRSTLTTMNNLGLLYKDQGRLAEAEQMLMHALQGYEALGDEDASSLSTINNLGSVHKRQGKIPQAKKMYMRALKGYQRLVGWKHISTLDVLTNLGSLYSSQGDFINAGEMLIQALHGYEALLGTRHISTLNTVNNLGILYHKQGQLDRAEQMLLRALRGKSEILGQGHASTMNTVSNLGLVYSEQGRLAEAEQMLLQAQDGYEKAVGSELVESYVPALNTTWALGDLYLQHHPQNARKAYTKALAGFEISQGKSSLSCMRLKKQLEQLDLLELSNTIVKVKQHDC